MRHLIAATLLALVVVGGIAVPVRGDVDISGTISGDSTLTPTNTQGIYVQNFTGTGDDTIFGSFTTQSNSTADFSKPPIITLSGGSFSETLAQGTLLGTSSGSGTANGQGTATVTIDFVFTGGTGLFMGATGEATFTGTIATTSATTESITGTYTGTLSLVPEPSSLTLLATAMLSATVVFARRRKKSRPRDQNVRNRRFF